VNETPVRTYEVVNQEWLDAVKKGDAEKVEALERELNAMERAMPQTPRP